MPSRLLDVVLPADQKSKVASILDVESVLSVQYDTLSNQLIEARILVASDSTEDLVDKLDRALSFSPSYRMIILRVEAVLPRPEIETQAAAEAAASGSAKKRRRTRVSREELYNSIAPNIRVTSTFIITVILSAIVASVGLYRNDVAIIIGAMVLAPLLGPNIALALGTTLGDMALCRKALLVGNAGLFTALLFAVALGLFYPIGGDERPLSEMTQILSRARQENLGDIAGDATLALAAGVSGVLAFTTGVPASLIGVMVAVALLPPLVAVGLLLGSSLRLQDAAVAARAMQATYLLLTNVICVNLAGVTTFLLQGVRPNTWWKASQAKRATSIAILIWLLLLVALFVLILLRRFRVTPG